MDNPTYISYAMAIGVALLGGLLGTPVVRSLARRWDFVDKPDGGRKAHKSAVSLGGGLAVFLATLAGIASAYAFARMQGLDILNINGDRPDRPVFIALLQAACLTIVLGLVDDRYAIRGRYKLLGQIGIAALLVYSGLRIEKIGFFGETQEIGWLSIPITMVWLLGTINAINLIDGIDGLASSVGVVLCLTVAAITAMLGHFGEAVIVIALAGALLGFLRYNFAPASIYLGDTGSMLIGLIVGAIAAHTSVKSPAAIALAIPFAVWSIPILDSAAAILRRKLTGRSLFAADRGHLHHSLLLRGWSVRQASLFITLICATTCLSAVLSTIWRDERIALLIVTAVVLFLISTKTFGHIEFALLKNRFRRSAASLSRGRADGPAHRHSAVRLQGSRQWERLWEAMVEQAGEHGLVLMKLEINIPALHEVYYANWEAPKKPSADEGRTWRTHHPLMLGGEKVGSVELEGLPDPESPSTPAHIMRALDFLEPVEADVNRIREQLEVDQQPAVNDSLVFAPRPATDKPTDPAASAAGSGPG